MKLLLLIIFVLSFSAIKAIGLLIPASAVHNASSGLIFISETPSGTHYNPAYSYPGIEIGFSYLYNIRELPFSMFHYALQKNNFGFYTGGKHLNNPLYRETNVVLGSNYQYRDISVGALLRLLNNKVVNYHNEHRMLADIGLIWRQNKLMTGFALKNIFKTKMDHDLLPVVLVFEFNYKFNEYCSVSIGTEKEVDYEFTHKIASVYNLYQNFSLLASYQHEPQGIGAGFIVAVNRLSVSYGLLTHQYLSPSHYITVGYKIPS